MENEGNDNLGRIRKVLENARVRPTQTESDRTLYYTWHGINEDHCRNHFKRVVYCHMYDINNEECEQAMNMYGICSLAALDWRADSCFNQNVIALNIREHANPNVPKAGSMERIQWCTEHPYIAQLAKEWGDKCEEFDSQRNRVDEYLEEIKHVRQIDDPKDYALSHDPAAWSRQHRDHPCSIRLQRYISCAAHATNNTLIRCEPELYETILCFEKMRCGNLLEECSEKLLQNAPTTKPNDRYRTCRDPFLRNYLQQDNRELTRCMEDIHRLFSRVDSF